MFSGRQFGYHKQLSDSPLMDAQKENVSESDDTVKRVTKIITPEFSQKNFGAGF